MKPLLKRMFSAHVMGGCGMAGQSVEGVACLGGVHWQVQRPSVHDGSLFPTSMGVHVQSSVYGLAARLATGLANLLTGRSARLA